MGFRAKHPILALAAVSFLVTLVGYNLLYCVTLVLPNWPRSRYAIMNAPVQIAFFWLAGLVIFGLPAWAVIFLVLSLIRGVAGSISLAKAQAPTPDPAEPAPLGPRSGPIDRGMEPLPDADRRPPGEPP